MPPSPWQRWAAPAVLAVVLIAVLVHAAGPVTTNDLYWHVSTGELLVEQAGIPSADVFSYTAGHRPWFLHEWLTQVLFYGTWWVGDLYALRILTGLAALAILGLVWRLFRRELGAGWGPLLGVAIFLLLGADRLQTRPTLFSIVCTCVLVHALTRPRLVWSARWALGLIALAVCWVNLHSVGLLAPVLYGAFVAGQVAKLAWARRGNTPWEANAREVGKHIATWFAMAGATLLTPSGISLWGFSFQDKSDVMEFVGDEWGRFHLMFADNESLGFPAYCTILAVLGTLLVIYLAAGIALTKGKGERPWLPDPSRIALIVACVGIALLARRFQWMLCLALGLGLGWLRTAVQHGALPALPAGMVRLSTAVVSLAGITVAYSGGLRHQGELLHVAAARSDYYTAKSCAFFELPAVDFLRDAGIEGNVFCHYGSGGILSYHLHPKISVFIDSRIDVYGRDIYLDYVAAAGGMPRQGEILEGYGTDLYFRHWDLAGLVDPEGWVRVYRGSDGEIWLRDVERNRENVARCERYWAARGVAPPR